MKRIIIMEKVDLRIQILRESGNLQFRLNFDISQLENPQIVEKQPVIFQSVNQLKNVILYLIETKKAKILKLAALKIYIDASNETQTDQDQFSQLLFKLRDIVLQIFANFCKFLTELAIDKWRDISKIQALNQNQSHSQILLWKFLKQLTFGNLIRKTEFKQLFTNQFSYLKVLHIGSANLDNNLMVHLSKFMSPSLKQLSMFTVNECTADSIKLLHKQCHYKLHKFSLFAQIPSLLALHCIRIPNLKIIVVIDEGWAEEQNKSINSALVLKQLIKTKNLLQKHLKPQKKMFIIDQLREFRSKQYYLQL